jgi:flavodoxin
MARALVVYESMFGNSEQVALAVAAGLREVLPVDVTEVSEPPAALGDYALLVLGGPTHAFSMSRTTTRRDAREQGATHGSVGSGLREWLAGLPPQGHAGWFATFDTRVTKVRHVPGSAARSAARAARRHGLRELVDPESFYVVDVDGPLADGELDRARRWGRRLGAALPVPA